jgi:hypothetical protein
MSAEDHQEAVTALAAMIAEWWQCHCGDADAVNDARPPPADN